LLKGLLLTAERGRHLDALSSRLAVNSS